MKSITKPSEINWNILHIAEKKHNAETLEANKNHMKKTWTILKGIINSNKMKRVKENFKLQDNTITKDKITISEKIQYFLYQHWTQSG